MELKNPYLSMIYLLWSFICRSEYDVSTRHLRALITYWCHVCCLRFWRDDLIVDDRQMVSLISVHGRGSLSDVYGLLHFSLVPVGFTGQYFKCSSWTLSVLWPSNVLLLLLVCPGLCVL